MERILLLIISVLILSGCNTLRDKSLNIYQPDILELDRGVKIQTSRGVYAPQKDEVWYSEKSYKDLAESIFYER